MSTIELKILPKSLRLALVAYLILLTLGVLFGLAFLYQTTSYSPSGTSEWYRGSTATAQDDFDIPEHYAKTVSELLITTHNHLIGFAFIFVTLTIMLFFCSGIPPALKSFLMIDPFVSVAVTFLSIWGLRFIHPAFVYLVILGGVVTYVSYIIIVGILLHELLQNPRVNTAS